MAEYSLGMDYPKVFILCCVLLGASQSLASKTTRRFEGLPETGEEIDNNNASENSRTVIIRHDLPGRIIFHESTEFLIELEMTTPKEENNSNVKALYTSIDNNTILLQVYKPTLREPEEASETDKVLVIILSSVGAFVVLGLVASALCYFCYWKKRQRSTERKETEHNLPDGLRKSTPEARHHFQGSQGSSTPGSKLAAHLMIVALCACALHAQLQPENVDINVYFPRGFFRPDSKVFLNSKNYNEIKLLTNDTNLKISVFDVPNAGLVSANHCSGTNQTCLNGACDPIRGRCICPRKMRANREAGGLTHCVFKCNENCPSGSFELSPCNHTHPAVCKKCRPLCSFNEFESGPCAGKTDRNCTDISKLPRIKVSRNIVHEDVLKVKDDPSVRKTITSFSRDSLAWLNRSSGLAIRLKMISVDFSTTFQEVKHDVNDNSKLPQSASSVLNYCSFPVPDYYEINLRRQGKTVKYVKGDPGRACPSYDGASSITKIQGDQLSCNGAENPVVRLFGENSVPDDFLKEESSRQCYNYKQNCNECRDKCSSLARENPVCNLTEKDVTREGRQDYGEHFTYCFDCCFQENCTCSNCACSLYNASCIGSQVTCVEAELFSVPFFPVFPSSGKFKCHVELLQHPVFEIEATVWKDGELVKTIENFNRSTSQDINGHDFGYMLVRHPSTLRNDTTRTIMISGEAGKSQFEVGWYETEKELKPSSATQRLFIQPQEPFKINSKDWPRENCQTLNTENFATISSNKPITNFKKFPKLTAHLAKEENIRLYKVYNNSGLRQVEVEMPQGRSVLRHAFPETVIYNDRSFTGHLLKNRTFWTIRVAGRVSLCPGFFVIRLTDQDRPNVDVYHYDVAITNEDCSFAIEFHLPSGGDTNMIDKQFVVRLTDSRKTMKLILVSPRRIPEFEIPDVDDDFDLQKLEVLIPFGGASGGMFIVLVAILIYGYKTRPKDSYQRDRDNELHFRHLLFVVWFVGMRLVKSFLLTLTVFCVILTAIHYKNVMTLQDYKAFHKHQKSLEEDFIRQMDSHRVQEINRQWARLGEGKLVCDKKLQALNVYLDEHFKEMKEKQEEEMRRKSIILAASRRIEKQFNATKAKFERERNRLNEEMRAYSNEINSRLSKIQGKIENNFWLKAAKGMHKAFSGIARLFGKSMKPFIRWVGLSVSFPSINLEMPSFEDLFDNIDIKMDYLNPLDLNSSSSFKRQQFTVDTNISIQQVAVPELNISSPLNKERAKELLALEWIVELYRSGVITTVLLLLDILWFVYRHSRTYQFAVVLIHGFPEVYELEKIYKEGEKKQQKLKRKEEKLKEKTEKKAKTKESKSNDRNAVDFKNLSGKVFEVEPDDIRANNKGMDATEDQKRGGKQEERTKSSAEAGENKRQTQDKLGNFDEGIKSEDSKEENKVIANTLKGLDAFNTIVLKFLVKLKELNYQINNTNLVPMCVVSVMAILSVYVVIVTAKHSMNVDTLDVIGYFDLKMAPLLTMRKIVNTRITSNAFMVNEVHIPYYENRVNARIAFFRKKAEIYRAYQCSKADLHNEEYCSWAVEPGASCDGVRPYNEDFLSNLTRFECNLEPVLPQRFTKFDRILYKEVHKKAIAPYVAALRSLILDTFYMILVVIGIFVFLKILGIAMFVLLKKFDLVRQVKHYQSNQDLKKEMAKTAVPHCITYPSSETIGREIRPHIKISQSKKVKLGPVLHEGQVS